ncbi:MAG: hypothetical protein ACJAT2_002109 [Bacteriovoracaceae bacterium]|jgi:hypothetical protein
MKRILVLIATLLSSAVHSSEIDSFTDRYVPLLDSRDSVNKIANRFLDQALSQTEGCEEKDLYKKMRKYFKNHLSGEVTNAILTSDDVDKRYFHLEDSIYRDFKWWNSFVLVVVGRFYKEAHGAVLNYNGHLIGSDKFEHLFGRGFLYFKRHHLKGKKLKKVLKYGRWQEKWTLGSKTTGVFSFADQAANFNGMRFWNHLLQKRPDHLGEEAGPLIVCKNNRFTKIKNLDFTPFIDDSMDEGLNCSKFLTKKQASRVIGRVKELEADGQDYACPIKPESTRILTEKYGYKLTPFLFNLEGHSKL